MFGTSGKSFRAGILASDTRFSAFRASPGNPKVRLRFVLCPFARRAAGARMRAAYVAQLVEHVLGKDEVSGSIPLVGSRCGRTMLETEGAGDGAVI